MKLQKTACFVCVLPLVLFTACPEAPVIGRKVVVNFPVRNQSSVSLVVKDAEIQGALKLADEVLISAGFTREHNPSDVGVEGFVASYSKLDSEGQRRLGEMARVYAKPDSLEVVFPEGRYPSADVRKSVSRVLDLLKINLRNRYGADRIRVVTTKS
ncbi:MAG: hypothetical protein ABSD29_16110 [Verrucomicrobiota bacterium]|jgi:hypothetical protein